MKRVTNSKVTKIVAFALLLLVAQAFAGGYGAQKNHRSLRCRVAELEAQVADLEDLLQHFSRDGDDVYITGANLNVVNGLGETRTTNSLGNIIVGYNEDRQSRSTTIPNVVTGSHMLVVGEGHWYQSYGGIVVGFGGTAGAVFSSVLGGTGNKASGDHAVVVGGYVSNAAGDHAVVVGGSGSEATGGRSTVVGGRRNEASGDYSLVSGGNRNTASAYFWFVGGGGSYGYGNTASGYNSTVIGGDNSEATGTASTVIGGWTNTALGDYASVIGGRNNKASGKWSTVSGGNSATASNNDEHPDTH